MKKKIVIIFVVVLVCVSVSFPAISRAVVGLPFGGRIVFVLPCVNGLLIVVAGLPVPGPYIITPAVIPYAHYAPFPGNKIQGSFVPGIPCYIPPFVVIPTLGAVTKFGTSLVPGP